MKKTIILGCILSFMMMGCAIAQKVTTSKIRNVMASPYRGTPGEVPPGQYVDNANAVLIQRVPLDTLTPGVNEYLKYDTACKCWTPSTGIGATGATGSTGATGPTGATSVLSDTAYTPATTDTVQLQKNNYHVITPAATIALLTLKLPSSPADKDVVELKFEKAVTSVHWYNGTVVTAVDTTAAIGTDIRKIYRALDSKWH